VTTDKVNTWAYTATFDQNSREFSEEPGRNEFTLLMCQSWANDKLRGQGHLFLNEVLDMLGLPRTREGQSVGWVWKKFKSPPIDFGLEISRLGQLPTGPVSLTFNVQGDITDEVFETEGVNDK
jgi:hypothetical protein